MFPAMRVHAPSWTMRMGKQSLALLLLGVLAIAAPHAAVASGATTLYYPDDGPVHQMFDSDFAELVENNGRETWIVAFHADGCQPCDQLAPHFAKAAKSLKGVVNFAHVFVGEDSDSMVQSLQKLVI